MIDNLSVFVIKACSLCCDLRNCLLTYHYSGLVYLAASGCIPELVEITRKGFLKHQIKWMAKLAFYPLSILHTRRERP